MPADVTKEVIDAVNDMAYWLKRSTGKTYTVQKQDCNSGKGIKLQWLKSAGLSSSEMRELGNDGQSFFLQVKGNESAVITGSGTNSLINGIYTFLQELGFRWYMPGDNWVFVPETLPPMTINKRYTPDFRNRSYFASGGANAVKEIDPSNTFRDDFYKWNIRNRFNTDYEIKGHTGMAFYREKKAELDKHPEYFCNGKVNANGRIDIANSAAVRLFKDWAFAQIKPSDIYPTIGVDPADGSGDVDDCLPKNMRGISTWSDKYFWLANQVAGSLPADDQNTVVQLYAYASHADIPAFELHKKVYPILIPYAYQRVTTPENFITKWSVKMNGRPMGIYDYWGMPVWTANLPQFNIYSIPEKLRFWKNANITSLHLESSFAKGPMGHVLWLSSQLMWNTSISFDKLYLQFLNQCFGPAASDIKRMYDRWSKNYQGRMEVDNSLRDLKSASEKTKDKQILWRIAELKAYVHYMKLYYHYEQSPVMENYNRLINYLHRIHSLRLVQTSAMETYYIKKPKGASPSLKKVLSGVQQVSLNDVSLADIENIFSEDLSALGQGYKIPDFTFDIKNAIPKANASPVSVSYISGPNQYLFYINKSMELRIRAGCTADTKLTIQDDNQKVIYEKNILASANGFETITVRLVPGAYTLHFGATGRFARLELPAGIVFVSTGMLYYDNAKYPMQYLYVPPDVETIIYEDKYGPGTNRRGYWLNPDGKRVDPQKMNGTIYKITVPQQFRGQVWTLNIGHRAYTIMNIPHYFSLTPFTYNNAIK